VRTRRIAHVPTDNASNETAIAKTRVLGCFIHSRSLAVLDHLGRTSCDECVRPHARDEGVVHHRRRVSYCSGEIPNFAIRAWAAYRGPALFEELNGPTTTVMCRGENIRLGGSGVDQPWEYQANRGMASLLLPRSMVAERLRACLKIRGFEDLGGALERGGGERLVRDVANMFDLSLQMTVYRLQQLGSVRT